MNFICLKYLIMVGMVGVYAYGGPAFFTLCGGEPTNIFILYGGRGGS